jgi:signal transduction histidine kinase
MKNLMELISKNEDWLLRQVVEYAKVHEYTRYTSTLIEAWRISIASLNVAMFNAIQTNISIGKINLDTKFNETAIDQFSIEEVHRHRSRGVTLGMFLGLVKYYRRSYFDLIREQNFDPKDEREYLAFLESFFDRFEIGYSVEWNSLTDTQATDELRTQNRTLANEKNKYLTIFESLYDPVILLDNNNNNIENINQAAAELFQEYDLPAHRYYDQQPVEHAFPWLAQEIAAFWQNAEQELVIFKSMQMLQGERHFQVKMKRMQDISEKYRGTVLILNDITERIKKEEAITLNRVIQKWVNTLVDISRRISSGMDTDEILLIAMELLYNLLHLDIAVLGMWEAEEKQFHIKYQVTSLGTEKINFKFSSDMYDQATFEETANLSPIQSENIFPIMLKMNEQLIGGLWVGRGKDIPFSASDKMMIESLAQQISIAIEHAFIASQLKLGAIVEERARLAREMHDGLAQILGFLSLEMQSLELLIQQGKIDETLAELSRARTRIRDAQAEVRENILNLRTALSKNGEAIPFLCEYIKEFGIQTGIETHIEYDVSQKINLLPICEVQLVRIIQEALTNIRLHADANHVWVKFHQNQRNLCVEINDDGVGFVETEVKKHFGLKSMRERTESVSGKLEIVSNPGHGTRINLCLPTFAEHASLTQQESPYAQTIAA